MKDAPKKIAVSLRSGNYYWIGPDGKIKFDIEVDVILLNYLFTHEVNGYKMYTHI